MLVIALLLGSVVFNPTTVNRWIGVLLLGVLLLSTVVYGWLAYRNYRAHLSELNHFMEKFAQQMA